jgi:lipid A ethanolaminephosphotransferase
MRNEKSLRYAITPANVVWSLGSVAATAAAGGVATREPPDPASRVARAGRRPTLLVVVVGETVRAANWAPNGYVRATTPELAARADLASFTKAAACGTSTEVSVPCMFSPYGRADYDASRIRLTDSALHVIARAGVQVLWRDNQAGCKGVCAGLNEENLSRAAVPGLCDDERCFDEVLLHRLDAIVRDAAGDLVVVLHQLGNHGPAYFRRYPQAFRRWMPTCDRNELRDCEREEIVNAYDNAVLYTDRFLSRTIAFLETQRGRFDVAMTYVSDHGESLGERGLYLHGVPYAFAPREQLEVPMFWWLPEDAARGLRVDLDCLRERAGRPSGHDDLYHSLVGLLEIATPRYRPERDVFAGCRR